MSTAKVKSFIKLGVKVIAVLAIYNRVAPPAVKKIVNGGM